MPKYWIQETKSLDFVTAPREYEGSLRGAKMSATRGQVRMGTVLKIFQDQDQLVCTRNPDTGEWFAPEDSA